MREIVESMTKQMKLLEAPEAHFTAENALHTENLTVVVSVYDNIKPADKVMRELMGWAESEGNQAVLDKIAELQKDMSWNPPLSARQ